MILGEQGTVTVSGLDILVDGDVSLNIERNVIERASRGKAVKKQQLARQVKLSGSINGTPNTGVAEMLKTFIGTAGGIDSNSLISSITLPSCTLTFVVPNVAGTNQTIKLSDVQFPSLNLSVPTEEALTGDVDFVANGISFT